MQKEAKDNIERLIKSGYEELYLVTNYISNDKGRSSVYLIYNRLEDALNWVRKAHSIDSVFQKIENESYDLPEVMEDVGTPLIIWLKYTNRYGVSTKQEFLIQRVN